MPSLNELVVILFVVMLIFGAPKLPQLGDALGRAIRNFKKASRGEDEIDVTPQKRVPPPKRVDRHDEVL